MTQLTKFFKIKLMRSLVIILILLQTTVDAQVPLVISAPQTGSLSAGFFIPNSTAGMAYSRAAFFIHRQEMAPFANVSITSFSIPLLNNTNTVSTVGNFTLYFQNTGYNRIWLPWNFANVVTGMTMVYAGTLTIPSAGTNFISVNLQTPFLYSGSGLHLAYAWENAGPYTSAPVNAICTDEFTGIENYGTQFWTQFANSSVSPPPTIGGYTFWRPCFRFGASRVHANDVYVVDARVPGKVLSSGTTENTVLYVGNSGLSAAQNVSVNMLCGGVNSFSATQVIPNLAVGATQSLTFSGFAPSLTGLNTISLSILNQDQDLQNNTVVLSQSVTCNEVSGGFFNGNFGSAYWGSGQPGILAYPFISNVSRTLTAIKLKVSNYPTSGTVAVSGVVCNASGSIIATTPTMIANSAATNIMPLSTPLILSPNAVYYYGVEVPVQNVYPIAADFSMPLTPTQAFEIPIGGGTPVPLLDDMGYVYGINAIFNYSAPVITSSGNKYTCSGSAVTLSASSVTGYSWTTGATTSTVSVAPVTTTTYYVRTFNSQCNTQASVAVFVSPLPTPSITGSSTLCEGSSKVYNAAGAWSYTWSTGIVGNQSPITAGAGGTQMITVQGANVPCPAVTASFQVQVKPAPSLQIISPYLTLCNSAVGGKTLQLTGQPLGGVFSGTNVSTSGVVTPVSNGVITAMYSYTNVVSTCTAATTLQLPVSSCLGIESSLLANQVKVSPNPSSDGFYTIACSSPFHYRLVTIDGSIVAVAMNGDQTINGSLLKPGLYILEITSPEGFSRIKLIRE